jgi:targeting protein for Xklp2
VYATTAPHSLTQEPTLLTSVRARPTTLKPRDEREAEEVAAMPAFRASTIKCAPMLLQPSSLCTGCPPAWTHADRKQVPPRLSLHSPLIFSTSGQLGVHKVEPRGPTEPRPFHFVSDDRAEARAARHGQALGGDTDAEAPEIHPRKRPDLPDEQGSYAKRARRSMAVDMQVPCLPRSWLAQLERC